MSKLLNIFIIFSLVYLIQNVGAEGHAKIQLTEADKKFFLQLKNAVKTDDAAWIADHTSYPLSVNSSKDSISIKDKRQFIKNYQIIVNNKVKKAVLRQDVGMLFKNWRGVMVGDGELWFLEISKPSVNKEKSEHFIFGINN